MIKIIGSTEYKRIVDMLNSQDSELRNLGTRILSDKVNPFRFSFKTIVLFHIFLLFFNGFINCYLKNNYEEIYRSYGILFTLSIVVQTIYSIFHLISIWNVRDHFKKNYV